MALLRGRVLTGRILDPDDLLDAAQKQAENEQEKINDKNRGLTGPAPSGMTGMPRLTFVNEQNIAAIRNLAGLATPMALRVAVTLGLPDRLRGEGTAVEQVATELNVSPVALEVLLGHLATLGIIEHASPGYRTTDYGATLCTDADNGLTNFLHLDMAGGRAELAFVELLHSITTGRAAYSRRYGQDFWADLAHYGHLCESFDQQMTHRFREQIPQIVAGYDWARFDTIVDVGGGHGTPRRDSGRPSADPRPPGRPRTHRGRGEAHLQRILCRGPSSTDRS
ncbi:MAG TPA: hypothetical protein VF003_17485 [Pseudonocardiaceae bacterium]